MRIFHYDAGTGIYVSEGVADESPLEEGVYLIPAHATEIEPPEDQVGYYRVFSDGAWGYVPVSNPEEPPTETPVVTTTMVDIERDRRIDSGFVFNDVAYQSRPGDRENIQGAYSGALTAKILGASDDLTTWSPATNGEPFVWIAMDNSLVVMSVGDVLAFGQTALAHKQGHIMAARTLKDMSPIPQDYQDDAYWP